MTDLIRITADAPSKWYKALTISGKPAGLGFECPKCHLCYTHSAPEKIFHCGAEEHSPRFTALLPKRSIGGAAQLPPNFLKFGTW
jgi:hypothetical protein